MIYFDNNATTAIAPEVFEAMRPYMEATFGNPSSAYSHGRDARAAVERSREQVAALLSASSSEIVFTSCGTESDNWSILGALRSNPEKKHVITTRVEHEAVRKLCEQLEHEGYEATWLDVDEEGGLDLDQLRAALRRDTAVVSTMLANNETGVTFPVDEIARIVRENSGALFHVDAVNAAGKVEIDLRDSAIDLLSISGHKFHGPKGIGALYVRDGVEIASMSIGGGQEGGRRAGTEAVHQIVGLGAAAQLVGDLSKMLAVRTLRDRLENEILTNIPDSYVNGSRENRLPNTSNISFENLNGEAILAALDNEGICVSTGSACHAGDHKVSPVLQAMNVPYSRAMGSIRFSLGRYNTEDEVDRVLAEVEKIVARLRKLGGE